MNISLKISAIIPAAGIGKRMQSKLPKQYIKINKKTILEHTINSLLLHRQINKIVVVLNKNDTFFQNLKIAKNNRIITTIGGNKRTKSVFQGLEKIYPYQGWVIIHDAVRPCLHEHDFFRLISIINTSNKIGGILGFPVYNTIKYSLNGDFISSTINRKKLWNALTPQIFQFKKLYLCLKKIIKKNVFFTDESSALEYFGYFPQLVLGRSDNIKITTKEDLQLVKSYFSIYRRK